MLPLIARGLIGAFRSPLGRKVAKKAVQKAKPAIKKAAKKLKITDNTKPGAKPKGRIIGGRPTWSEGGW